MIFNIGDEVEAWMDQDIALGFTEPMRGVIMEVNIRTDEYLIDDGSMIAWYKKEHLRPGE